MRALIFILALLFFLPPSTASAATKRRMACEKGEVMVGITKGKKILCKSIFDVIQEAIKKEVRSDRAMSYTYPISTWLTHHMPNPFVPPSEEGKAELNLPSHPVSKEIARKALLRRQCAKKAVKQKVGNAYSVDRSQCTKQFEDRWLARQSRFVPHYQGGKHQGFKIVGIRAGSLFAHMGLKSGDILTRCNEIDLTTMEGLRVFFDTFKTGKKMVIELLRRNERMEFDYTLLGPPAS